MKTLCAGTVFCLTFSNHLAFAENISATSRQQPMEALESKMQNLEALKQAVPQAGASIPDASMEQRLQALESKMQNLEALKQAVPQTPAIGMSPDIEVVLSGQYGHFSQSAKNIPGFQTGSAGMRYGKGFSLQESAIRFGAAVDEKFSAVLTLVVLNQNGHDDVVLEEAFIQTLALPWGAHMKVGRLLPIFGHMNEEHKHADDFVDRPLLYRAYLNDGFGDEGLQASVVLPMAFHSEWGGGVFRGNGFPASAKGSSPSLFVAYARIGGGAGGVHAWRLGAYYLHAKSRQGRAADGLIFSGNNNLYNVDFKYSYAPTQTSQFVLQGEYVLRTEKGSYALEESLSSALVNTKSSGFYAQALYRFMQSYRLGYRYAFLSAPPTPLGFENTSLDAGRRNPWMHTLMAEYNTSAFGRFRLQYNNSKTHGKTHGKAEHQLILQYTLAFGADDGHNAH